VSVNRVTRSATIRSSGLAEGESQVIGLLGLARLTSTQHHKTGCSSTYTPCQVTATLPDSRRVGYKPRLLMLRACLCRWTATTASSKAYCCAQHCPKKHLGSSAFYHGSCSPANNCAREAAPFPSSPAGPSADCRPRDVTANAREASNPPAAVKHTTFTPTNRFDCIVGHGQKSTAGRARCFRGTAK